jgi:hypothetical protein
LVPLVACSCCLGCSPARACTCTRPYWSSSSTWVAIGTGQVSGVAGVQLGAVAARPAAPAGRHPRWRVGVEAAPRTQPHQDRGGRIGQPQRQAGGVVAGVKDEQRQLPAGGQAFQQCADLGDGQLVVVVVGCRRWASTGAVQELRCKLSWAIHW